MNWLSRGLWVIGAGCVLPLGAAESPPPSTALDKAAAAADESNPILAPRPTPPPTTPSGSRAISETAAAKLAAVAPKFVPGATPTASNATATDHSEARDQPRNTIIRLPSYIVLEKKMPVLNDNQMLTIEGQRALELKRHPGLLLSPAKYFYGVSKDMLDEERAIDRKRELIDLVSLLPQGDSAQDQRYRKIVQEMFTRTQSWVETGGSYQDNRR